MIGTTNSNNFMPQSNWNQNDEKALDFIKNRPFYTEDPVETVVLEEQTVTIDGNGTEQSLSGNVIFIEGETYVVNFNGTKYECNVVWDLYEQYKCIGNGLIINYDNEEAIGDEPFVIFSSTDENPFLITTVGVGTYTISINHKQQDIIKLSEKYLPKLVGKNVEGIEYILAGESIIAEAGAEIFNSDENVASGECSHAEGIKTQARGRASHAEGVSAKARGNYSHAEGSSEASGDYSHSEGYDNQAYGDYSHTEGYKTTADGEASHSENYYTIAASKYQHAQGKYNIKDSSDTYAHIVGNGTGIYERSNAHTLDWQGNAWFSGDVYVGSTSGKNKDEGSVKLQKEITGTPGQFVVIGDDGNVTTKTIPSAEEASF